MGFPRKSLSFIGFLVRLLPRYAYHVWMKRVTWRRCRAAARVIRARQGTVLRSRRIGDLMVAPGYYIMTVRPGTQDEVIGELLESATRAGYRGHQVTPNGRQLALSFQQQGKLPYLSMELFPAGMSFRGSGKRLIPDGHTGVVFSFG